MCPRTRLAKMGAVVRSQALAAASLLWACNVAELLGKDESSSAEAQPQPEVVQLERASDLGVPPPPQPLAHPSPQPAESPIEGRATPFAPGTHRIALGNWHTCSLREGVVYCWGANSRGQLGDRTDLDRARPVPVTGIPAVRSIAAAGEHTCALADDGTVYCWGDDEFGQVSGTDGSYHSTPQQRVGITNATALATSGKLTCAVVEEGRVRCWGRTASGGDTIEIEDLAGMIDVGLGNGVVCALHGAGHVECRGANYSANLGVLDRSARKARVEGLEGALAFSIGSSHGCAQLPDDEIACWGSGSSAGIAFPPGIAASQALVTVEQSRTKLPDLPAIAQVSAGFQHTCLVDRAGRVGCMGANGDGQVAPDGAKKHHVPRWLSEPGTVVEVTAGAWHSCALSRSDELWCWGDDSRGQLGTGKLRESDRAVGLVHLEDSVSELALRGRAGLPCDHDVGEAGVGLWCAAGGRWMYESRQVAELAGDCRRLDSGGLVCGTTEVKLGGASIESLGDGGAVITKGGGLAMVDHDRLEVWLDAGVSAAAAGGVLCIADERGAPACWSHTDLDRAESEPRVAIPDVTGTVQLTVTWDQACALTKPGDVKCWALAGANAWIARTMPGLPSIGAIAGMERHVCAIAKDGELWCWGRNFHGELGDGTAGDRLDPARVMGIPPVVAVEGEDVFTCARTHDDDLWCWGEHPFAEHDSDTLRDSLGTVDAVVRVVGLP